MAGLGARGMVPIFDGDRHLGVVEFGMSFGQPFFDAFKASFGVDAGLHLVRGDAIETFAGTYGKQPLLDPADLRAALAGEPQLVEIEHDGQPLAVYAAVIRDYSGKPLGVVEVARDRSHYEAALTPGDPPGLAERAGWRCCSGWGSRS